VPKIIRHAVGYVVSIVTFFGIIAFVFGQDITSLAATSGALALLIGFANRVDISNIFAGIGISVTKPFRIGDWVQVNNLEEGRVIDMTSRVTKIETRDRTMLSIPNTMVAGGVLENFNYPDKHYRIKIELQTAPIYKFERVEKVLLDAAISTEGVLKDPAPYVVFHGQGDSAAIFAVHCFVDDYGKRVQYTQDIWRRIWRHLEIAGVELATPRREILMVQTPEEDLAAPLTILRKIPLFQMLSDNDKIALSERVRPHQLAQGETIFNQGDSGTSLFLVVEGTVGLWLQFKDGKAREVVRVGVADCFGEIELLSKEARRATAIAATDTMLFEFSAETLTPLLEEYADLTERLEQTMSIRERRIEEQIDLFQLEDIDQDAPSKHLLQKTQHILSGKKTRE
jgi:branched-chain amino acid transport system substrate-binding protein